MPVHDGEIDKVLQPLQLADDERPVRWNAVSLMAVTCGCTRLTPGTRIRDIEVIPSLFGRELCSRLVRNEVAEGGRLAVEGAGLLVCPLRDFAPVRGCLRRIVSRVFVARM